MSDEGPMIARLCLSDLHLGDDRSTLSSPDVVRGVVSSLREISDGAIDTLILNGDIWEECVPSDMTLELGLSRSVVRTSQYFFGPLFSQIKVRKVVLVPGNHDLCLWNWYARNKGIDKFTPYTGASVCLSDWPWRQLLASFVGDLSVSYPIYHDLTAGPDFPALVFTHGHLLDPLVRGEDGDAEYAALAALGCSRSDVSGETTVTGLARAVHDFVLSLWRRYSPRDRTFANYVMRRLLHPQSCEWQNGSARDGAYPLGDDVLHRDQPPAGEGYMGSVSTFLDLLMLDPSLPSPVGSIGGDPSGASFVQKPSCLVFGHDHLGARKTVVSCGVPFYVVDSGGWTSEFEGHLPHCRALVWRKKEDVVPESYFVRARTKGGGIL